MIMCEPLYHQFASMDGARTFSCMKCGAIRLGFDGAIVEGNSPLDGRAPLDPMDEVIRWTASCVLRADVAIRALKRDAENAKEQAASVLSDALVHVETAQRVIAEFSRARLLKPFKFDGSDAKPVGGIFTAPAEDADGWVVER